MYNIFANTPAVILATRTISFAAAGLNASNTRILYKIGVVTQSWVPDSIINPLPGFEYNQGYLIDPIADIDLTGVVQTQICGEDPYTPPVTTTSLPPQSVTRTTTGADTPPYGGATYRYFPELVGLSRLITFSRDGITQQVIYSGVPTEKQVLFDGTSGKIYPPTSNPFAQEDLQVIYVPQVNVVTIPIDAAMTGIDDSETGGSTFAYFPELIGVETLLTFSRDGVIQTVIYEGTPSGMQVLFVSGEGKIYPPTANPFGAEDIHVTYKKQYT